MTNRRAAVVLGSLYVLIGLLILAQERTFRSDANSPEERMARIDIAHFVLSVSGYVAGALGVVSGILFVRVQGLFRRVKILEDELFRLTADTGAGNTPRGAE